MSIRCIALLHFVRTIFANQVQLYIIINSALKPASKILIENYFPRQCKGATQTPDSANFRYPSLLVGTSFRECKQITNKYLHVWPQRVSIIQLPH